MPFTTARLINSPSGAPGVIEADDVEAGGDEHLAHLDVPEDALCTDAHDEHERPAGRAEHVVRELDVLGRAITRDVGRDAHATGGHRYGVESRSCAHAC